MHSTIEIWSRPARKEMNVHKEKLRAYCPYIYILCLFGDGVFEECPVPVAEKLCVICDEEADLLLLWRLYRLCTD
jgi:hypothetical protein